MPSVPGAVPAFLICYRRFVREYGLGTVLHAPFPNRSFTSRGYLFEADALDALSGKLEIDAAGSRFRSPGTMLTPTPAWTSISARPATPKTARSPTPAHDPSPSIGPIADALFYSVRLYPGDTATTTGRVVYRFERVSDAEDQPRPGLYASAPDMANPTLGPDTGGGCNIGPARTFGYIAAMRMAEAAPQTSSIDRGASPAGVMEETTHG